jgi:hypothetical protein
MVTHNCPSLKAQFTTEMEMLPFRSLLLKKE